MRMQGLALCPSSTELPYSINSDLWETFYDICLVVLCEEKEMISLLDNKLVKRGDNNFSVCCCCSRCTVLVLPMLPVSTHTHNSEDMAWNSK